MKQYKGLEKMIIGNILAGNPDAAHRIVDGAIRASLSTRSAAYLAAIKATIK